jgi:hypothetical protein
MRSLNEEAVAKSGGNFIVTLDQIQQSILEQSSDATEILSMMRRCGTGCSSIH